MKYACGATPHCDAAWILRSHLKAKHGLRGQLRGALGGEAAPALRLALRQVLLGPRKLLLGMMGRSQVATNHANVDRAQSCIRHNWQATPQASLEDLTSTNVGAEEYRHVKSASK